MYSGVTDFLIGTIGFCDVVATPSDRSSDCSDA
jgi:hypothetical protein